jgi:hypothetical protein
VLGCGQERSRHAAARESEEPGNRRSPAAVHSENTNRSLCARVTDCGHSLALLHQLRLAWRSQKAAPKTWYPESTW